MTAAAARKPRAPRPKPPSSPVVAKTAGVTVAFIKHWSRELCISHGHVRNKLCKVGPTLGPELAVLLPKDYRGIDGHTPLGAPGSWTWQILDWEDDPWAQRFVEAHPGGATLDEVGQALGVERERVRQIEREALMKLAAKHRDLASDAKD